MTKLEATLIRALRDIGCTWRKIAELWSDDSEDGEVSQERGRQLCQEAAKILGLEDLDNE